MGKTRLVSACLLGIKCRYDRTSNENETVKKIAEEEKSIPICPEQLGGLSTPREAMALYSGDGGDVLDGEGKVLTREGIEVTENMIEGARETLKIAQIYDAEEAILKARSPSCGVKKIYRKNKGLTEGTGVTAELLKRNGIDTKTEEDV